MSPVFFCSVICLQMCYRRCVYRSVPSTCATYKTHLTPPTSYYPFYQIASSAIFILSGNFIWRIQNQGKKMYFCPFSYFCSLPKYLLLIGIMMKNQSALVQISFTICGPTRDKIQILCDWETGLYIRSRERNYINRTQWKKGNGSMSSACISIV